MIKRILALILVICLMIVPGGCRLAVPDGEMQDGSDRLIGMLITKDHYSASENEEDRVYARLSYEEAENDEGEPLKFKTYVFDGIDGGTFSARPLKTKMAKHIRKCAAARVLTKAAYRLSAAITPTA